MHVINNALAELNGLYIYTCIFEVYSIYCMHACDSCPDCMQWQVRVYYIYIYNKLKDVTIILLDHACMICMHTKSSLGRVRNSTN